MNIELYEHELNSSIEGFTPPPVGEESVVLKRFEVNSLRLCVNLMRGNIMKAPAVSSDVPPEAGGYNEGWMDALREQLGDSLSVLYAVCRHVKKGQSEEEVRAYFDQVIEKMQRVSREKNNDYSPFNILKCGNLGLATRIGDKISRICNGILAETTLQVKDESLIDTALDQVNYCVYHLMIAKDKWVTEEERSFWIDYLKENGGSDLADLYQKRGDDWILVK